MKILKNPNGVIYDTINIDSKISYPFEGCGHPFFLRSPLHQTHEKTDYEFLSEHFPKDHSIFDNFSQSYYYRLVDLEEVT